MRPLESRLFRSGFLILLIGFIAVVAYVQSNRAAEVNRQKKTRIVPADKDIPVTGLSLNETKGTVPGDSKSTELALKQIYALWPA